MKKDLFGYQNQGIKYELYRPSYPTEMVQKAMQHVKTHDKYLDIATGTGKILFQLQRHFSHSTGLDLSNKMIQVCEERIKQQNINNVVLKCQNYMTSNIQQKYNLITIGQALHWFPIRQFLIKSKSLLTPDGVLVVYGYILDALEGDNAEDTKLLANVFSEFYDKRVKPNHDFFVDDLHTFYSDKQKYPFQEIYSKVIREKTTIPIAMDKNGVISYVKTLSGYNTYHQRHPTQQDPIKIMQQGIPADMKVTCIFHYFSIICCQ